MTKRILAGGNNRWFEDYGMRGLRDGKATGVGRDWLRGKTSEDMREGEFVVVEI